jgi:predicted metal-dependent phosphoesterase TrpH
MYQILHSHTKASDGEMTHAELLDLCKDKNISTIAFTDHDTLPDVHTLNILEERRKDPLKWIVGIELSSGLPLEMGGGVHNGFHILGLFVDPFDQELLVHCSHANEARITRMQKIVKNLNELGFKITEKDCLEISGGESVGRPHIVQAIMKYENNHKVIKDIERRMKSDAENNDLINTKYQQIQQEPFEKKAYGLFLSDDAYISDIYVDYEYWADMDKTVGLIRHAGGVALIAHYFTVMNRIPPETLDELLKNDRIDGVETVFGLDAYGTTFEREITSTRNITKELVRKYDRLESGGVDLHKKEHLDLFLNSPWYAKDTEGLAEKIISSNKVDTKWSSYNDEVSS